jgi:hypothetical protein
MWTENILTSGVNFPVAAFLQTPVASYIGERSEAFTLYLSAAESGEHWFDLYSEYSKASPQIDDENKWSHLTPRWRFVDEDNNTITRVKTNDIATIVGTTTCWMGSAQFYYIDDIATPPGEPVLIWATLDTSNNPIQSDVLSMSVTSEYNIPGFANSRVIAISPYFILGRNPVLLEITRDGRYPLFDYYWKTSTIPYIISVKGGLGLSYPILYDIPINNETGLLDGNVDQSVTNVSLTSLEFNPEYMRLSATDEYDFEHGGFMRGSVKVNESTSSATITAGINVTYYVTPPCIWIANPENNKLHKISGILRVNDSRIEEIETIMAEYQNDGIVFSNSFDTPYITSFTPGTMELSGFGGIYGFALDSSNNVWATDIEMNNIYHWSNEGELLHTINLSSYDINAFMPASVTVNSEDDIWVSLYQSASVLKINHTTYDIVSSIQIGTEESTGPVLIETDKNDNIWITYNNVTASEVFKYDGTSGILIGSVSNGISSTPFDMLLVDNNIWITYPYDIGGYSYSSIIKYNINTGAPLVSSNISNNHARYLTYDGTGGVFVTLDKSEVIHLDSNLNTIGDLISAGSNGGITDSSVLEGISLDLYGNINVINSLENRLYMYNVSGDYIRYHELLPDDNLNWINANNSISAVNHLYSKSARAFGDWTGIKRVLKYDPTYDISTNYSETTATIWIEGQSNPFEIRDFRNYDIRRFNESEDVTDLTMNMVHAPHMKNNPVLADDILGSTFSRASSIEGKAFGRQYFEKTANFVQNHSDIDTCGLIQLYSLAKQFDVPIDEYGIIYGAEIQRLMDIISVNQQVLWGTRCGCNKNITNKYKEEIDGDAINPIEYLCKKCNHYHSGNRGELFDPFTYMVTADVPFIVEERSVDEYTLITPPPSSGPSIRISDVCNTEEPTVSYLNIYPLISGLYFLMPGISAQELDTRFCFFDYINIPCTDQTAGVINWDDEYNTLNETLSTTIDWYGNDTGTIEIMLNYALHKGLGLIDE